MKTHRITRSTRLFTTLALGLAASATAVAQSNPGPWGNRPPMTVQLASAESDAFNLGQLAGKPLRGANQEQFGTVSDFLVDAKTGRVHYAVVPSGAGASGETFRLVPMAALERAGGTDGLAVRIGKAQWDQVGTMTQQELPARVALNPEQQARIAQQFAVQNQPGQDAAAAGELVRASTLKGQALRSGNEQIGTIEDVAIDVRHRTAAAVLNSMAGLTGSEQRFLVPFSNLQWSAEANAGATTTLGRNDFQQVQTALTPTGFTGAPFTRGAPPNQALQSTVQHAVNQASGGASNVQVAAETWLILRGSVDSEQKRADVERAVQQAAPGLPIDNKLTVTK